MWKGHMKPETKTDKALRLLREAGTEGICGITMMQQGVGTRYAARVYELRQQGKKIERKMCRVVWHNHTTNIARYYLDEE